MIFVWLNRAGLETELKRLTEVARVNDGVIQILKHLTFGMCNDSEILILILFITLVKEQYSCEDITPTLSIDDQSEKRGMKAAKSN